MCVILNAVLFGEGGRGTHGLYENIPHKALHNQRCFYTTLQITRDISVLTMSSRWDSSYAAEKRI